MRYLFTLAFGFSVLLSGCDWASAGELLDDFSSLSRSQRLWQQYSIGSGPLLEQSNGHLQMALPAGTTGIGFGVGYASHFHVQGDFDVQVDFRLIDWPATNGTRLGLIALTPEYFDYTHQYNMQRNSLGEFEFGGIHPSENYSTNFNSRDDYVPTTELSGSLRLVRTGGLVRGYYTDMANPSWTLLSEAVDPTLTEMRIVLQTWSGDGAFAGKSTTVQFDNFYVVAGLAVPEPSTAMLSIIGTTYACVSSRASQRNKRPGAQQRLILASRIGKLGAE